MILKLKRGIKFGSQTPATRLGVAGLKPPSADSPCVQADSAIPAPSHVLVLPSASASERDAVASYHGAVLAGLDHGTSVDLHLDPDNIPGISAGPLTGVAETFELVADCHYRGELPGDAEAVAGLLDVTSWEDVAALERLGLSRDGRPYLVYIPSEPSLELDDGVAEGVAADVRDVTAELPAGLLAAESLVEWRDDDTDYALHPPHLRAGEARFDLSKLVAIRLDRERRRIDLGWDTADRGLLGRLFAGFGPSRPTRFTFETGGAYERVAREFESLGETLGVVGERDRSATR